MMNENPLQITIGKEVELEGVGLHTGNKSKISFRPAPANTGIRFFRSDLAGTPMIPARLDFVLTTVRGTNPTRGTTLFLLCTTTFDTRFRLLGISLSPPS